MKWQTEIDPDAPITLVEKIALGVLALSPFITVKLISLVVGEK